MLYNIYCFDFYIKNIFIDCFEKNIINYKFMAFQNLLLNVFYINYEDSNYKWIFPKIYHLLRSTFIYIAFNVNKRFFITKKKKKLKIMKYSLVFFNGFEFMYFFDFYRFFFIRVFLAHKQLVGTSKSYNFYKDKKYLKIKKIYTFFSLIWNDLNFRLNNIIDALLNRNNFIYNYDILKIFFEFIFIFKGTFKNLKLYFSFFGFFLIDSFKLSKKYKNFVFYTLVM